jgi:Zn-dependent M28 family amino/carboxypeptidase
VHLSRALVEQLLRGTGFNLRRLQAAVDAGGKPVNLPLGDLHAELRVPERETLCIQARNVVGFLEGRDPVLREQWILIGAHHDHLGSTEGPGDAIFNGADDNASGVTGVLALARLFTRRGAWREEEPPPADRRLTAPLRLLRVVRLLRALWLSLLPRRSLVFATFSAEEQGLFGSQVLARELAAGSSGRLVRMLNLDMIGRNPGQPVHVLGDRSADELREVVERAALPAGGPVAGARQAPPAALPAPRFSAGRNEMASDHASFFEKGIPYLFFFTGLHGDYHGVNDEADQLSYPRLAEVIRLAWRVASLLADAP